MGIEQKTHKVVCTCLCEVLVHPCTWEHFFAQETCGWGGSVQKMIRDDVQSVKDERSGVAAAKRLLKAYFKP